MSTIHVVNEWASNRSFPSKGDFTRVKFRVGDEGNTEGGEGEGGR